MLAWLFSSGEREAPLLCSICQHLSLWQDLLVLKRVCFTMCLCVIKVFKSQAVCIHIKEYKQTYKVETNEREGYYCQSREQPLKLNVFSQSGWDQRWRPQAKHFTCEVIGWLRTADGGPSYQNWVTGWIQESREVQVQHLRLEECCWFSWDCIAGEYISFPTGSTLAFRWSASAACWLCVHRSQEVSR